MRKPCRALARHQGKMVNLESGDELHIHFHGIIEEIAIWRKGETFGVDDDPPLEGRYRFVAPSDGRYDIWIGGIGESSVHPCLWVIEDG